MLSFIYLFCSVTGKLYSKDKRVRDHSLKIEEEEEENTKPIIVIRR